MARISQSELEEVLDNPEGKTLTSFINTANRLVTAVFGSSSGLTSDQLKDIELYLAAHIASMLIRRPLRVGIGQADARFEGYTRLALDHTGYGQLAKVLDTTGTLANLGKMRAVFKTIAEEVEFPVAVDE